MPAPQAAITATWLSFTGWHHLDGRGHKTDYHNLPKEVKPQSEYGDGKKTPTSSTEITEKQPEKRVLWPLHLNLMALCGEARAGHTHTHTPFWLGCLFTPVTSSLPAPNTATGGHDGGQGSRATPRQPKRAAAGRLRPPGPSGAARCCEAARREPAGEPRGWVREPRSPAPPGGAQSRQKTYSV